MTIVQRNSAGFTSANANISVAPSAGSFGSGTTLVLVLISNTTWPTPTGWTLRHSNVGAQGIYGFDRTAAGEASFTVTPNAVGQGAWFVWELSSGSTYVTGQANENGTSSTTYAIPGITPTAGNRHILLTAGGNRSAATTVASWTDGFVEWADIQSATTGDGTFAAAADLDVVANGSTAYSSTVTYSAGVSPRSSVSLAYVNNAGDTTAPSVPTGLTTTAIGSTTADLSWNAATDDVGVTGYELQIIGP